MFSKKFTVKCLNVYICNKCIFPFLKKVFLDFLRNSSFKLSKNCLYPVLYNAGKYHFNVIKMK